MALRANLAPAFYIGPLLCDNHLSRYSYWHCSLFTMAYSSHLVSSTLDLVLQSLLEAQKKIEEVKDQLLLEDGELHPSLDSGCRTRLRKRERVESSGEESSGEENISDGGFLI